MTITEILNDLKHRSENEEDGELSIGDVLEEFKDRGFGPLLLAVALIAILPTGAIPGVPTVCAVLIILVSIQLIFGKKHPWVPSKIRNMALSAKKMQLAHRKATPVTQKIDRYIKPRLGFLTGPIAIRFVALLAIIVAAFMVPMELVPFACAIPGTSIALLGIGLSARDGTLILASALVAIGAAYLVVTRWPF